MRAPLALAGLALVLTLGAGCGGDDPDSASDTSPTDASSSVADGTCTYPADGQPAAKEVEPPPSEPSVSGQVPALITTSVGDLAATLDADSAPCTVNSFVSLAGQGYYDDTPCHRLTTGGIHVLQCGDPTGTGTGGPGYSYDDELTGSETYPAGTLAMANAGPNTNGSQFFIVYGETPLRPDFTVFGTIDAASLKIIEEVAAAGSDESNGTGDGKPLTPVQITRVTFSD